MLTLILTIIIFIILEEIFIIKLGKQINTRYFTLWCYEFPTTDSGLILAAGYIFEVIHFIM